MISSRELYYLNKALDGKEVFGIKRSESFVCDLKSEMPTEDSLIKKGILNEDGSLNDISFNIIRNLEKYKQADQYINFNNIFISAEIGKDECTFIRKNENGEYDIERIPKYFFIQHLIKSFPFMLGEKEIEGKHTSIEYQDFMDKYLEGVKENEWFYLKKGQFEYAHTFNIYFVKEGITYKYNTTKKMLAPINPKDIRIELLKLFNVKGSYSL